MSYTDAFPNFKNEDYTTIDYEDSFDEFVADQWWTCHCDKCNTKFVKHMIYKLQEVVFEEDDIDE